MKIQIPWAVSCAAVLAAAALASGCKTSVNTVQREPGAQRQMVTDKRIITDANLAKKVYIVGVAEAPTPGGVLQIQIEVMNRTRSMQRFAYEVRWFDFNGMQVSPTSVLLQQTTIEAGETKFLSSVAPTPACKDFQIKFIER